MEPSFGPRGLLRVGCTPSIREEVRENESDGAGSTGLWGKGPRRRRLQSTPTAAYEQAGLAGWPAGAFLQGL